MSRSVSIQIAEIEEFLRQYRVQNVSTTIPLRLELEKSYRDFHSILIWQEDLDNSSSLSMVTKITFNEATSDTSQAFLCALMSFYKPSRCMLRSAVENAMRVVVLFSGGDPSQAKTVYKLIEMFKQCAVCQNAGNTAAQTFLKLYDDLCHYVHSSTPMHMDLRIPFGSLACSNNDEASSCLNDIRKFSSALNELMFMLRYHELQSMHHRNADWVRDRLRPAFKRQVTSSYWSLDTTPF